MAGSCAFRVQKDLKELMQSPNTDSPPIYVTCVEDKLDHVVAMIVGPPQTPYHFGFYFFDMRFPQTYPNAPPKTKITTTDYGRVRFNPNLYADGKVCLSILGTWRGETSEVWRSAYSVGYVLNAIQSLIMNCEPYHNEPGFEKEALEQESQESEEEDAKDAGPTPEAVMAAVAAAAASPGQAAPTSASSAAATVAAGPVKKVRRDPNEVRREAKLYADKITHESLRIAVCDVVENALAGKVEHFRAEIKREFQMRFETYLAVAEKGLPLDGQPFTKAPFEYPTNIAEGTFDFKSIVDRLHRIHRMLDEETEAWRRRGRELTSRQSYVASTLRDEHSRLLQDGMHGCSGGPVDPDTNVFVWNLSIMQPEGLFEEGMFDVEIVFPESKDEYPRVRFKTKIFHPNISDGGYACFPIPAAKQDSIDYLFKAIRKLLTSSPNPSHATWVNIEAAELCFSQDPEKQKQWKRRAKQLARRSMEDACF